MGSSFTSLGDNWGGVSGRTGSGTCTGLGESGGVATLWRDCTLAELSTRGRNLPENTTQPLFTPV